LKTSFTEPSQPFGACCLPPMQNVAHLALAGKVSQTKRLCLDPECAPHGRLRVMQKVVWRAVQSRTLPQRSSRSYDIREDRLGLLEADVERKVLFHSLGRGRHGRLHGLGPCGDRLSLLTLRVAHADRVGGEVREGIPVCCEFPGDGDHARSAPRTADRSDRRGPTGRIAPRRSVSGGRRPKPSPVRPQAYQGSSGECQVQGGAFPEGRDSGLPESLPHTPRTSPEPGISSPAAPPPKAPPGTRVARCNPPPRTPPPPPS